jgi:glycosyltransferase involved in cell wall biosynthesis
MRKIIEFFLLSVSITILIPVVAVYSMYLLLWKIVVFPFLKKPSNNERNLLLMAEATNYDTIKQIGVLYRFEEFKEDGYFDKLYVVTFPSEKRQKVVYKPDIVFLDCGKICTFLKQYGLFRLYELVNGCWLLHQFFSLKTFIVRKISIIRAGGWHYMALGAFLLHKLTGIPFCTTIVSDDEFRFKYMQDYGMHWNIFGFRKLTTMLYMFLFPRIPFFLVIRESLVEPVCRYGARKERIRLWPHGVDIERFNKPFNLEEIKTTYGYNGKKLAVFVGRLSKENYVYEIISIAQLLSRKRKDLLFILIGNGIEGEYLKNRVEELGIGDTVKFLGWKSIDEVVLYRVMADVNLCLLGGYSLIEACLSGKPVIAYDVEWHYELVKNYETGYLLPENDVQAVAKTILEIINHPEKGLAMGQKAKQLAMERHDRRKNWLIKQKIYDEIIATSQ